ncbi:MAG: amidohydrolase [Pirellulales bacterium]|nr:amidohydrolase [Pirellulales bacterium]
MTADGEKDSAALAPMDRVRAIDTEIAHVWMIRTFLKHADESEDDEDLRAVVRDLYDFILAVGPLNEVEDPAAYLKMAKKKMSRLKRATALYEEIQPEVSGHTNFVMAARSLRTAVDRIAQLV